MLAKGVIWEVHGTPGEDFAGVERIPERQESLGRHARGRGPPGIACHGRGSDTWWETLKAGKTRQVWEVAQSPLPLSRLRLRRGNGLAGHSVQEFKGRRCTAQLGERLSVAWTSVGACRPMAWLLAFTEEGNRRTSNAQQECLIRDRQKSRIRTGKRDFSTPKSGNSTCKKCLSLAVAEEEKP